MNDNEIKKDRSAELDAFWDIDSLLPQRAARRNGERSRLSGATDAVEISFGEDSDGKDNSESVLTPGREPRKIVSYRDSADPQSPPCDDYIPAHPFIHRVRVYDRQSPYNYYEQFLHHANASVRLHGSECPHVPFFSYVPQYSQLSKPQLDWYLWWRDRIYDGVCLDTDYSYILLFIYEIINTSGHGDPQHGIDLLCMLWQKYRDTYPRLDRLLGEWICDFALLHHLPPPTEKLADLLSYAMPSCSLKEFYMSSGGEQRGDDLYSLMLTYCSNYSYKSSKFAIGDAKKLYDTHIPRALAAALGAMPDTASGDGSTGGNSIGIRLEDTRVTREAYAGALCSYAVKKRIEIDYSSFTRSYALRFLVTDIVKYSENRIRAELGVKSRLSVDQKRFPDALREAVDAYFDAVMPRKKSSIKVETQDYDRLYDAPASPISTAHAADIEASSWKTTERLLEAFEDGRTTDENDVRVMPSEIPGQSVRTPENNRDDCSGEDLAGDGAFMPAQNPGTPGGLAEALSEYIEFLEYADKRDFAGERGFAARRGGLCDLIADRINEIAADILGDIILTECDGGYILLDEYRKEIFNND